MDACTAVASGIQPHTAPPAGICSGKKTVAQYLVEHHGFRLLHLAGHGSPPGPWFPSPPAPPSAASAGGTSNPGATDDHGRQTVTGSSRAQHHVASGDGGRDSLSFATAEALLDFVTTRWRGRFVMTDIPSEAALDVLMRRPFFLLLSVDAPLTLRWRRFRLRSGSGGDPATAAITLDAFVARSDAHLYDADGGLQPLISRASVRLLNTSSSLAHLYATLGKLDIPNPDRLRPGWDTYFMALASLAAQRSNCMKRRVGCVLVGRERRVISTGYNGTPRGIRNCADGGCPRCNAGHDSGLGLATCLCIHAEENALLEAGRERIRDGAVLYCDTCPCLTCSIKICQVGISEVVYAQGYSMDQEAAAVFVQAGVRLRQFVPVSDRRCPSCTVC